jgi:hypothetical protein
MAIIGIVLFVIVYSLQMEHWKTKLLPLLLSGIILLLAGIELSKELFGKNKAEETPAPEAESKESTGKIRGYLIAGTWVLGFLICIVFFGFFIAIPLFTIAYMRLEGTAWWLAILFAVCSLGLMYVLSEPLAGIPLYRGVFFDG